MADDLSGDERFSVIYCFDLDDTLCMTSGMDYASATPMPARIERVNQLFEGGHTIKVFTARGSETGIDWREVTERQLTFWGLKYHILILGKPAADVYVDDKACHERDFEWQLEQSN